MEWYGKFAIKAKRPQMKIEHLAVWVSDLETARRFYETYFEGESGEKYHNPKKSFTSYFISFKGEARLELMHRPNIAKFLLVHDKNHKYL